LIRFLNFFLQVFAFQEIHRFRSKKDKDGLFSKGGNCYIKQESVEKLINKKKIKSKNHNIDKDRDLIIPKIKIIKMI